MRDFHLQIAEKYKGDKNNFIQNLSKEDEFDTGEDKDEDDPDGDEAEDTEGIDQGNKPIRFFEVEISPESSLGNKK